MDEDDQIVDVSPDPFQDIEDGLVRKLEAYVYVFDEIVSMNRLAALSSLAEEWSELDFEDASDWFANFAHIDWTEKDEDGQADSDAEAVPSEIVQLLSSAFLLSDFEQFVRGAHAFERVIDQWERQTFDFEKLLGHLILRHGCESTIRELTHEELQRLHVSKHQLSLR